MSFDAEAVLLAAKLPPGARVAAIGSTSFWHPDTERTCTKIGERLADVSDLILLTGGVSGVGERIGRGYVQGCHTLGITPSVHHVLPHGYEAWDYGATVF